MTGISKMPVMFWVSELRPANLWGKGKTNKKEIEGFVAFTPNLSISYSLVSPHYLDYSSLINGSCEKSRETRGL